MTLSIGILCDSLFLKKWQEEIISYVIKHPELELKLLVINDQQSASDPRFKNFGYKLLTYIDRNIFHVKYDVFTVSDREDLKKTTNTLYIKGKKLKFGVEFQKEEVDEIETYNLDVLIRFGFGIIKGNILKAAKYGVWSLHHGDNKVNRGGPPAFWEVVNREPVTGITLQRLSADLDGGSVIRKCFIQTNSTSFYRNQNSAFWAGVELFTSALEDLCKDKLNFSESDSIKTLPESQFFSMFYSNPLYKDPPNLKALKIFSSFWYRRIGELFNEKTCTPTWSICYKYLKNNNVEQSLFRYEKLKATIGFEWADPFVVANVEGYYLFFEELETKIGKAHISYLKFDNYGRLKSTIPVKVVEESFHLSYPFIFEIKGQYYMMPEAADSKEVWIYKCVEFPDKWEKYHQIFSDKEFYDPTLFYHNNMWYLFGTEKYNIGSSRDQYLNIYYSKNLFGNKWTSHPCNPVTRDVRGARPAGKIFKWKDRWIRPGQIGAPKYGYGIQFNEIIKLSETEYEEIPVDSILPIFSDGLTAVHTINFEKGFSVIDSQGI